MVSIELIPRQPGVECPSCETTVITIIEWGSITSTGFPLTTTWSPWTTSSSCQSSCSSTTTSSSSWSTRRSSRKSSSTHHSSTRSTRKSSSTSSTTSRSSSTFSISTTITATDDKLTLPTSPVKAMVAPNGQLSPSAVGGIVIGAFFAFFILLIMAICLLRIRGPRGRGSRPPSPLLDIEKPRPRPPGPSPTQLLGGIRKGIQTSSRFQILKMKKTDRSMQVRLAPAIFFPVTLDRRITFRPGLGQRPRPLFPSRSSSSSSSPPRRLRRRPVGPNPGSGGGEQVEEIFRPQRRPQRISRSVNIGEVNEKRPISISSSSSSSPSQSPPPSPPRIPRPSGPNLPSGGGRSHAVQQTEEVSVSRTQRSQQVRRSANVDEEGNAVSGSQMNITATRRAENRRQQNGEREQAQMRVDVERQSSQMRLRQML